MPKRLRVLSVLCLFLSPATVFGAAPPGSGLCTAQIEEIRVDRTTFNHYNLLVKTVFLGTDGECSVWVHTPDSSERRYHRGTLRCVPGRQDNPVWVTLDFGSATAYTGPPGTRRFTGTWSGETISGTW